MKHETFVVSDIHDRSAETWFGLVLAVACSSGVLWFVPRMAGVWKALPIVLSLMFAVGIVVAGRKVKRNGFERTRIDVEGVQQGDSFWPWDRVKWFYAEGTPGSASVDLMLQVRGEVFPVSLPVRPRFTPTQYEQLVASLKRCVGESVEFGGYQMRNNG